MPLYEFICPDCREIFEELLSTNDAKIPVCPKCGGVNAKRALSAPALRRADADGAGAASLSSPGCGGGGGFS